MDERFKMHRLYSTRFSAVVTIICIVLWFNYEYLVNNLLRWDLFIIIMVMAFSKLSAMTFYRLTN